MLSCGNGASRAARADEGGDGIGTTGGVGRDGAGVRRPRLVESTCDTGRDGTTGKQRPFEPFLADAGSNGLAVTADGTRIAGNLYWVSNSEGVVHVLAPDGHQLGTVGAGRNSTNVAPADGSHSIDIYL